MELANSENTDKCVRCETAAMALTPRGRMCGGHALLESAREWNQGNWTWSAQFDSNLLVPPRSISSKVTA